MIPSSSMTLFIVFLFQKDHAKKVDKFLIFFWKLKWSVILKWENKRRSFFHFWAAKTCFKSISIFHCWRGGFLGEEDGTESPISIAGIIKFLRKHPFAFIHDLETIPWIPESQLSFFIVIFFLALSLSLSYANIVNTTENDCLKSFEIFK